MASAVVGALRVLLSANTAEFTTAMNEAEGTATRVSRSLARLVNDFSGKNITDQANKIADALQRLGGEGGTAAGLLKLTDSELQRVASTVSSAVGKFQALGQEVPPSIAKLSTEIKALGRATDELPPKAGLIQSTFGKIGPALAAAFSVTAVTAAIHKFTDFTSQLSDLSAKTGISTTGLQKLQMAFAESGVSIDSVTTAIQKMGTNLVSGDKGAVNAIKQLGLNVDELIRMAPDQAFVRVADAIGQIPNPMERSTVALEVFGRTGQSILAGMTGHLAETTAAYERMGVILTEEVVAAGDKFGDTMTVLKASGMALIAQVLTPMLPALTAIAQALGNVAGVIPALQDRFSSLIGVLLKGQVVLLEWAVSAAELSTRMPTLRNAFGESAKDVEKFRAMLNHAQETVKAFDQHAVRPATQSLKQMPPVLGEYGAAAIRASEATERLGRSTQTTGAAVKQAARDVADSSLLTSRNIAEAGAATIKADAAMLAWSRTMGAVLMPSIRDAGRELQNLAAGLTATGNLVSESALIWAKYPSAVESAMGQSSAAVGGFVSAVGAALANLPSVIMGAVQGGGDVLRAVGSHIGVTLGQAVVKHFGEFFSGALGSMLGGLIPILGSLLGPLLSKVGNWFRELFGGIPKDVQQARAEVEAFQAALRATLTDTQRAEAGTEDWKKDVIAVRDAFLAVGRSEAEALAIVKQLWDTDHPDRARAAMELINQVLEEAKRKSTAAAQGVDQITESGDQAKDAIELIRDAINRIPTEKRIKVGVDYDDSELPREFRRGEDEHVPMARGGMAARLGDSLLGTSLQTALTGLQMPTLAFAGMPAMSMPRFAPPEPASQPPAVQPVLLPVFIERGEDADTISHRVIDRFQQRFGSDVALDRHGMGSELKSLVREWMKGRR